LIALAAIDRVETAPADAIRRSGGRLRLALDGRIVPLALSGELDAAEEVAILRLTDGVAEIAYAIAEPIEIVRLPAELAPGDGGEVAGVALIGGDQVELIDAHALFAGGVRALADRPLCYLHCDGSGWMEAFLKPALEGAGYRCAIRLASGETPAVTLAMADTPAPAGAGGEVVRLTREADRTNGIYRYDRAGLLAAVAAGVAGRRA
jgi:two-component system chemotaxis sensor kinase CheA